MGKQTVTEKIAGYIEISVSGVKYPLKFGINALSLIEELVGSITAVNIDSYAMLRAATWAAMVTGAAYKGISFELDIIKVGDLIDEMDIATRKAIMDTFINSFPKLKDSDSKKK